MMAIMALVSLIIAGISLYAGWLLRTRLNHDKLANAELRADDIIKDAFQEAQNLKKEKLLEADEKIFALRQQLEVDEKNKLTSLKKIERELSSKESKLDRKVDILSKKERDLAALEKKLSSFEKQITMRELELTDLIKEQNDRLEHISGLTSNDARKIQLENILEDARREAESMIREAKDKANIEASQQARSIVVQAIERSALDHVVETTVSIVELPSDDMKGRIIGREGRNIRTFETATGVDVLIDDTPEMVMLSGFDPLRREVARLALNKLIYDGRIHPGRIEEVIEKARQEIDEKIFEYGEQAIVDVGIHGLHHELIKLLGKLKFYSGQGQNTLQHSIEVATVAGLMAAELELDTAVAKRAGLLHEIGTAVNNYSSDTIPELSADLAKKFGESDATQNAILYANDKEIGNNALSPICILVAAANEISKARPGACKETLQTYLNRLTKLEEIANSFIGVNASFAIQAGREIRVIISHANISDNHAEQLATSIAQKIKNNLSYPGQIKVNVVREFRAVGFAK